MLDWCKDFPLCALCDSILSVIDSAHQRCYTQHELHTLLDAAGFVVRRVTGAVWSRVGADDRDRPAQSAFHGIVVSASARRTQFVILPTLREHETRNLQSTIEKEYLMIYAYVLIEAEPTRVQDLIKELPDMELDGSVIKQVHAVTGRYDLIAFVESPDMQSLGN
jgi:hypothetical protein